MKAFVIEKTMAYGKQRYRVLLVPEERWQVMMSGSHGPNDPPVGLSWKWRHIPKDKVPKEARSIA